MDSTTTLIYSIAPPIVVLIFGFVTRKVISSLMIGIALGAAIACQFQPIDTVKMTINCIYKNFEFAKIFSDGFFSSWNLLICIFLLMLGVFVALLQHSGAAFAYGKYTSKYINSKKSAEISSLFLSTSLFIDDYFSSLTVGSVMQPITDKHKIPRAKLAFLVDSMSAPLTILCPASSWVAAILGFLRENGVSDNQELNPLILANPFTTYLYILPYIFYSFILIASTWFIVKFGISYGSMQNHETIASKTGNLFANKPEPKPIEIPKINNITSLVDFFLPLGLLVFSILISLIYTGDWEYFGGENSMIEALQNSSAAVGLFIGGAISLTLTTIWFIVRGKIRNYQLPDIYFQGIKLMLPAVLVLMLAWSLGDLLRSELHTGQNLANFMLGNVNINLLPTLLFYTSALIALSIGSSWGSAATIFPIAIQMVIVLSGIEGTPTLVDIPMLFPTLGAVLAGCVAGDHISPISDTSIMTATSCNAPILEHIYTQLPYALPLIIISGLCFIPASIFCQQGLLFSSIVPLLFGIFLSFICLAILNRIAK